MLQVNVNSYVSLIDANTYFATRLNSDKWNSASDEDKEKALIMAAQDIDVHRYAGHKFTSNQPLEFPRVRGTIYYNDAELIVASNNIELPKEVIQAACEQAIYLLNGGDTLQELKAQNVASYSAGGASFSFNQDKYANLCPKAIYLLKQHFSNIGRLV